MSVPITVAYGDGIGPEIMESVLKILSQAGVDISVEVIEIGEKIYEQQWNYGIKSSAWDSINRTKILLKSPITTPQGKGHKSLNVAFRKKMGLYANIRPCISYPSVLKTNYPNLNVVVIRENEEDTYTGIEHRLTNDTYQCVKVITSSASYRICEYAFSYALNNHRKKVTCLVKDNIMKMTDGAFHKAFVEVSKKYPQIQANHYIVDIGMARIATNPEDFDVIVTLNLYGDIVSDILAQISGSVGLAGSANIGNEYAMFEAVHGSAPDIAGKDSANPSGLLNSAIQMLNYIEETEKAKLIYNAWIKTLEDGIHTADIYSSGNSAKKVGTAEFTDAIINNLGKVPKNMLSVPMVNYSHHLSNVFVNKDIQKRLVGVDISIDWNDQLSIELLVEKINSKSNNLELVYMHHKGLEIWPTLPMIRDINSDQICCRFYVIDEKEFLSNDNIIKLLSEINLKGINIVKIENLYFYNDSQGFSI